MVKSHMVDGNGSTQISIQGLSNSPLLSQVFDLRNEFGRDYTADPGREDHFIYALEEGHTFLGQVEGASLTHLDMYFHIHIYVHTCIHMYTV